MTLRNEDDLDFDSEMRKICCWLKAYSEDFKNQRKIIDINLGENGTSESFTVIDLIENKYRDHFMNDQNCNKFFSKFIETHLVNSKLSQMKKVHKKFFFRFMEQKVRL